MSEQKLDAVALKRNLQKLSEQELSKMPEKEQIRMLRDKYGHLMNEKQKA